MTQTEEAFELMTCQRCGRFSGPETLCPDCDVDEASDRAILTLTPAQATLYALLEDLAWLRAGWSLADEYDELQLASREIDNTISAIDAMEKLGVALPPEVRIPEARDFRYED